MKIVAIRQTTAPIASPMKNAYIDFSKMDVSVVAIITDVVRDGRPVVGYGFNSNGRYGARGLLQDRFIPRLLEADPATDWSKVNIGALREHLIDMNEVTLHAAAHEKPLDNGVEISCVQVAGLIARRILSYVHPGERLTAGQRYGFIRFGSRVDVYLPTTARPKVAIGDKVKATSTVLAEL